MGSPAAREFRIAAPLMQRLGKMHANHRRIARSALLIGVLTFLAKLFVASREVAIAWRYGVSDTADAYQLALTIVTWAPMMLISVVTVVLVPRLVARHGAAAERQRFIGELNGTVAAAGIALALLTWTAAPVLARLLGSGLDPATVHFTTVMCRIMSPVALLFVATGYFSMRLQARERFSYTVTEALPAMTIAAAVLVPLVLGPEVRLGWATAAGYALQVLVVGIMVTRSDEGIGRFTLRHSAPEWPSLYRNLGVMVLGQIVITLALPIDQAFAARTGPGAVATLGYANRIVVLFTSIGPVVFTRAFLPIFSSAIADGQGRAAVRHARQWSFLLMAGGCVVVAATWLLAGWGVSAVFERGAFTAADTANVAHVLRFGVIQVPFLFAGLALVQLLAAKRSYSALFWVSSGALAVKLILNLLLVERFGLAGLMCATAGMYAFSFAACLYLVDGRK